MDLLAPLCASDTHQPLFELVSPSMFVLYQLECRATDSSLLRLSGWIPAPAGGLLFSIFCVTCSFVCFLTNFESPQPATFLAVNLWDVACSLLLSFSLYSSLGHLALLHSIWHHSTALVQSLSIIVLSSAHLSIWLSCTAIRSAFSISKHRKFAGVGFVAA
jgi:hypothetical protein